MNISLLIIITGGTLTIISQLINLASKHKKPPEPIKQPEPIDNVTKNAYIANYTNANHLDRLDWIDQKLYSQKYYDVETFIYAIDQAYMIAKYGK